MGLAGTCGMCRSMTSRCLSRWGIPSVPLRGDQQELTLGGQLGSIGGSLTYNLSTLFIKVSILQFYLRFPSSRSFRLATYFTMFVAVGYSIPQAFAWSYHCQPTARYWDRTIPGTCIKGQPYLASACLNVATDIIILLLPIWLAWPLRLPRRQKMGVTCILMAGGL